VAADKSTVKVTFLGDATQLNRVSKDAADKTSSFGSKFAKYGKIAAAAAMAVGAATAVAGKALFTHAAGLEAMGNKAATVFGDQIGQVKTWAKANAAGMGLTSREVVGLAASFGDLLIPMGFTREQAAQMSTDVVGLSGALSQWSGGTVSAAGAADVLAKAMLGERDGLKALGISISDNDVKARLLKNGTDKLTGAALEQAKATATQQLIFEKSTDAQAAYEAGGNKLLTAQNTLKSKMKELYDEASVRLIPVFTAAATFVVDRMVPAFERIWKDHGPAVKDVFRQISDFITGTAVPAFTKWWAFIKDNVLPLLGQFAGYIGEKVVPILRDLTGIILGGLQDAFNNVRGKINENRPQLELLFNAWKTVWQFIIEKVVPLLGPVLQVAFAALGRNIGIVITVIGTIVGAFKKMGLAAIKVVDTVLGAFESMARAAGKLPGPLGAPFRAAADSISAARGKLDGFARALNGLPTSKTVTVNYQQVGSITNVPYSKRAKGGPVMPGRPYLVGEEGPEMIVPSRAGHVMTAKETAGALGGAGGTTTYNLHLHGDHSVSTADVPAMFRRMELLAGV
jgi:hypothetical protein